MEGLCIWTLEEWHDYWETACGQAFCMTTGTPHENTYNYWGADCPGCPDCRPCPECGGTGKVEEYAHLYVCPTCNGTGVKP